MKKCERGISLCSICFSILLIIAVMKIPTSSQEVEGVWQKDLYQVDTLSLADKVKAVWIVFNPDGSYAYDAKEAKGLLDHFFKQPKDIQRRGIFIHSKTFAIPDTAEEHKWMTDYLLSLYRNQEWRKSESELIEELRRACEKRRIPLFVNTSFNLNGKWKVLNPSGRDQRGRVKNEASFHSP